MNELSSKWEEHHPFEAAVLECGSDDEKMLWRQVASAWNNAAARSPELFRELRLENRLDGLARHSLVRLAGVRLLRLQCSFATEGLLTACALASPLLRHLDVAPSPDLASVPTSWALESLDVRGCLRVINSQLPLACSTSLRSLKIGYWKESDPDGAHGDLREWLSRVIGRYSQVALDIVASISNRAQKLCELHINGLVLPERFGALAGLKELESLSLPYAYRLTADAATQISSLPRLRSLNLRACQVDASRLANMEKLNMSCTLLTTASLLHAAEQSPNLRVLDLCYAQMLERTVLPQLAQHHLPLEMLGLGGFSLLDEDMVLITRTWPSLRNLGIGSSNVRSQGLCCLLSLPDLKGLCAHKLESLEESVVWELLKKLDEVDLDDCQWTELPSEEVLAAIKARPYNFDWL
eukprot:TRINITY_DN80362_c0_g1_i1.p1 TRINITY_DN80362_c0_g1~~TRINITY_DN80362_c0_g1_i1.p1  ORF type:complete len:428 (-),score=65.85 TRINITY_DN80362_c0_g1_i1:244-1476(-)